MGKNPVEIVVTEVSYPSVLTPKPRPSLRTRRDFGTADYNYARFPAAYNKQACKFRRLSAVRQANASSAEQSQTGEKVESLIPDGFVVPLVYELTVGTYDMTAKGYERELRNMTS